MSITTQYLGSDNYRIWLESGATIELSMSDINAIQELEVANSAVERQSKLIEELQLDLLIAKTSGYHLKEKVAFHVQNVCGIIDAGKIDYDLFSVEIDKINEILLEE